MEQHVIAAELSVTGAQELLTAMSSAHLAYNAEDGTPRVIPVGFFWTGTEFVISTATTSPKVAALRAPPDVALAIDGGDEIFPNGLSAVTSNFPKSSPKAEARS